MLVMMKNICVFSFLFLTNICCHSVYANDEFLSCFKKYENGTFDDHVFKECAIGYHCCGFEQLECCHDSNPYWLMARLCGKIVLLVLAIGTGIKYLSRKCKCCKEPEHLVFVNQTVDTNSVPPSYPALNYQPYPSAATGQLFQPNMATNMPTNISKQACYMGPYAPQQALNSFNPYNTLNSQGYIGPPPNTNNPQQIPQNPSKPSATSNIPTVTDSNNPLHRHPSNVI